MSRYRYAAILCIAPVVLAGVPRAAFAEDVATRTAKRHFDRGEKLYTLGKFDEALDEFQKAYDAKPIAAFLFNIGQCHRGLGDYESAIFSYKKYLELAPDAPNRDKVEKLISELEDKQSKGDAHKMGMDRPTRPPPVADPPPPDPAQPPISIEHHESAPVYKKWWFWTGVAVVSVAAGFGVYEATHNAGAPGTDLGNIPVPTP
jgi:tetratricopeptide (TPR) repeat protein